MHVTVDINYIANVQLCMYLQQYSHGHVAKLQYYLQLAIYVYACIPAISIELCNVVFSMLIYCIMYLAAIVISILHACKPLHIGIEFLHCYVYIRTYSKLAAIPNSHCHELANLNTIVSRSQNFFLSAIANYQLPRRRAKKAIVMFDRHVQK